MMVKSIKSQLSTATCLLLASASVQSAENVDPGEWDVSSALLLYTETDRVTAVEPIINMRKVLDTDESLNIKLTTDTLTGASGSGAVPSALPQTFTRPSGNGNYQTPATETPLDDTFKDTRTAVSVTWSRPAPLGLLSDVGANFSNEYDYTSFGASATLYKNLNQANTTISTGLAFAIDEYSPVGGRPVPFATMQPADQEQPREDGDNGKTTIDALVGVTQVIDANSLFQFNYSFSAADGYLTDPYKVISVVDAGTGQPVFENAIEPELPTVVYESRPDSRTRHSLYGLYKRHFSSTSDTFEGSFRYMFDDWGITSGTLDLRYRKQLADGRFLQPHIRYYQQGAADFYQPFYVNGSQPAVADRNTFGSADYRIAEFTASTIGLEYGVVNAENSWSIALEYYLQSPKEPVDKFGELSRLTLLPDVDALMFRVLYDF